MNFSSAAGLFPFQLKAETDQVLLIQLSEADYKEASFLDNRLMSKKRAMQWSNWNDLDVATSAIKPTTKYIFHIGHVGSTLLARLLGEIDSILSVREPLLLRQLAELWGIDGKPHSPLAPGVIHSKVASFNRWFARGFSPNQQGLVKASSFASDLAASLVSAQNRAVFLYVRPERYLQTILAGDNSRQELGVLVGPRMQRLHTRLDAEPFQLWSLPEAERAALCWVCEMAALNAASGEHVLWMDFDDFLADPTAKLSEAAEFINHPISPETAEELTNGSIMKQYSKAPEHGYSKQLRENVLADAARTRRDDIASALRWLDQAGSQHNLIGQALSRSN